MTNLELLQTGNENKIYEVLGNRLCLAVPMKESECDRNENFDSKFCKKCIKKWLKKKIEE